MSLKPFKNQYSETHFILILSSYDPPICDAVTDRKVVGLFNSLQVQPMETCSTSLFGKRVQMRNFYKLDDMITFDSLL